MGADEVGDRRCRPTASLAAPRASVGELVEDGGGVTPSRMPRERTPPPAAEVDGCDVETRAGGSGGISPTDSG